MDEAKAIAIARALGGEAWQSGGNIWLVMLRRGDGSLVVISDDVICLYADDDAFDRGDALQSIELQTGQLVG